MASKLLTRKALPSRRKSFSAFRSSTPGTTIHFFDSPSSGRDAWAGLCDAEFESNSPDTLVKRALLMVEGTHVDSKKRRHEFPAERIKRIAANTNRFISQFGRVPWQKDHKREQDANIGDLEGPVEVRRITQDDLPHPDLRHLVGRLGIFTDHLVAKGKDIVEQITAGRIKTLSPGIDTATDIIREVSATPTPAIIGLMTFKRGSDSDAHFKALTMDEAEAEMADLDAMAAEAHELLDMFLKVNECIVVATEDELQGQDPLELQQQAVEDYMERLSALIGLNEQLDAESEQEQMGATNDPNYLARQQGVQLSGNYKTLKFASAEFRKPRRIRKDKGRKRGKRTMRDRLLGTTSTGRAVRLAGAAAALGAGGLAAGMAARRGIKNDTAALDRLSDQLNQSRRSASAPGSASAPDSLSVTQESRRNRPRNRPRRMDDSAIRPDRSPSPYRSKRELKGLPSKRGTRGPNSSYVKPETSVKRQRQADYKAKKRSK
jgi:hypothetical protein